MYQIETDISIYVCICDSVFIYMYVYYICIIQEFTINIYLSIYMFIYKCVSFYAYIMWKS